MLKIMGLTIFILSLTLLLASILLENDRNRRGMRSREKVAISVDLPPFNNLPPHPGFKGRKTLLGIDSDNDGIRDDIQIAITRLLPDEPHKRAALFFWFIAHQEFFIAISENPDEPYEFFIPYWKTMKAAMRYVFRSGAQEILYLEGRTALFCNTRERCLMNKRMDKIINRAGRGIRQFEQWSAEEREKYERRFQEIYEREKERQK